MKPVRTQSGENVQRALAWRCVSAIRKVFINYRSITGVRVQIFFNGNRQPGCTYEDKLE